MFLWHFIKRFVFYYLLNLFRFYENTKTQKNIYKHNIAQKFMKLNEERKL